MSYDKINTNTYDQIIILFYIALLSLLIADLITIPEAFSGFSNTVVIMIAALFIVGEGVFQSGLAKKAGQMELLIPLAFASSMGGALTLIGTAPNLIANESLFNAGYGTLSFFDFAPIGLVFLIIGIAFLWFFGRKWLDKPMPKEERKGSAFSGEMLLNDYNASQHSYD